MSALQRVRPKMKHDLPLQTIRAPRRPFIWALVALVACSLAASIYLFFSGHGGSSLAITFLFAPFLLVGKLGPAALQLRRLRQGKISVSREGLWLNDALLRSRVGLGRGVVRSEGAATWVRLSGSGGVLDVAVRDEAEAQEVLATLGLDAKSVVAEFELSEMDAEAKARKQKVLILQATALLGLVAAGLAVMRFDLAVWLFRDAGRAWLWPVLVVFFIVAGLSARKKGRRPRLVIGADGISILGLRRGERFLGHEQIVRVAAEGPHVLIETALHEPPISLKAAPGIGVGTGQAQQEATLIAETIRARIQEARATYRELEGQVDALPVIARRDRSTRAWLDELRRIGDPEGEVGFRQPALSRERLWRVAEASGAPEAARVAAAIALSTGAGREEKERLRVLGTRSAAPKMRDRIRVVVDATDDAEVEAVLEEMDRDAERGA